VKRFTLAAVLMMSGSVFFAADAKPQYFSNTRDVHIAQPSQTNFLVVDEEIWSHARPDLGDLRLYSDSTTVPYALRVQGSAEYSEQHPVKVLNKGIVPDATQFLLDMNGVDVYDEVTLEINQRNFDRMATVAGANTPDALTWTTLTTAPIFDFTKQKLGSNVTIKVPPSNLRYLRVAISNKGLDHGNDILPSQVTGAKAANTYRANDVWDDVPRGALIFAVKTLGSVIRFDLPRAVPIGRIHFSIPADKINFRRPVTIETRDDEKQFKSEDEGWQPIASGDLTRVRSAGNKIHEQLDIATHDTRAAHWRVTIQNGDDPPLPVQLTAQTLERRVYFDPHGATVLKFYYGDDKVNAPVYDYNKFFRDADAPAAVAATLGPAMHNPDFSPRPDERPWSERNGWVLWVAMIVAVLGIGSIALRGLKKT
jgi:hypothetical protein